MQGSVVTLYKHLCDTGSTSEITVDLERRMSIEKVRIGSSLTPETGTSGWGQLVRYQLIGPVSVLESCPKADLPAHRPASSRVTSIVQGIAGCGEKLWGSPWRDLIAGEKPIKMRYMAMMVIRIIPIVHPLLKLGMTADLHRRQFGLQD